MNFRRNFATSLIAVEIYLGEFRVISLLLIAPMRNRDGGSSVGEDVNGRGMINYGCRGLSESAATRARAIGKGRKKKGKKGRIRRRSDGRGSLDGRLQIAS